MAACSGPGSTRFYEEACHSYSESATGHISRLTTPPSIIQIATQTIIANPTKQLIDIEAARRTRPMPGV